MVQFCFSKRLCCWVGLTPVNNEYAGKKKSVKITHAGICLTCMILMWYAALESVKFPF